MLPPGDASQTRPVVKRLKELGVDVFTGAKAKGLDPKTDALLFDTAEGQEMPRLQADYILVTVGASRSPRAGASRNWRST